MSSYLIFLWLPYTFIWMHCNLYALIFGHLVCVTHILFCFVH